MTLTKIKIGELIAEYNIKNEKDIDYPIYGININKEFMTLTADTEFADRSKYKLVSKNIFVFSGMQTGRDNCIRIGMYENDDIVLVSPAYTTFTITSSLVMPDYLFMFFRSSEKDRYGAFLSDGSIRSNLDWNVFCNIEIELPSIEIQQKYVDIYKGMVENQVTYETGLEDLKLVCDAYVEDLRRKYPCEKIKYSIERIDEKVGENISLVNNKGISIKKVFIETKADMNGVSLKNYKVVKKNDFAFNVNTARMGEKFAIALCEEEYCIVSAIYEVFRCETTLLPQYLMMWFKRNEFDRYVRYNSWGSARETFTWNEIIDVEIPIPSIEIQQSIVDIYKIYQERKV